MAESRTNNDQKNVVAFWKKLILYSLSENLRSCKKPTRQALPEPDGTKHKGGLAGTRFTLMSPVAQHVQKPNHFFLLTGPGVLITILLVLGLFFRFANLDKKVYWLDEILTSFRISGYSAQELKKDLLGRPEITVQDIQKYQH